MSENFLAPKIDFRTPLGVFGFQGPQKTNFLHLKAPKKNESNKSIILDFLGCPLEAKNVSGYEAKIRYVFLVGNVLLH